MASYRVHLVAKCFTQEFGIDNEETITLVARLPHVRYLLEVIVVGNWPIF